MDRHAWRWIMAGLLLATALGGFAVMSRDVWPGRCWVPAGLGYQTLELSRDEGTMAFCVRVPDGHSLASATVGASGAVFAYATAPSEYLPAMDRTLVPVEYFQWYLVVGARWSAQRIPGADGRPMILSPDGSLAIVTVDLSGQTGLHWVINTQDSNRVCEFTVTLSGGVQGCERTVQADGQYWDIASLYEIAP